MCVSQLLVTKQASIALDYFLGIGILYLSTAACANLPS